MGLCKGRRNCLKYLKTGWNRKEGRESKDSEMGAGKLSQGVSALKRGRLESPYELCTWKFHCDFQCVGIEKNVSRN